MGTKMFKIGSFEEEIASGMSKTLFSNQLENKYSFDRLAKAADYIGAAAELLDDTGFASQAQALMVVLKSLAGKKTLNVQAQIVEELPEEDVILEPNAFKQVVPGSQPLNVDYQGGPQSGRIYVDPDAAPQEVVEQGDPSFFDDKFNPLPIKETPPVGDPNFFNDKFNPPEHHKHHEKKQANAYASDPRYYVLKGLAVKIAKDKKKV